MNAYEIMNPIKSVTRWKASLITEIDLEIYPPINYPAIKTKEIIITINNFEKFRE